MIGYIKNEQFNSKILRNNKEEELKRGLSTAIAPHIQRWNLNHPRYKGKRISPQYKSREQIINALNTKRGKLLLKSRSTVKNQEKFQRTLTRSLMSYTASIK